MGGLAIATPAHATDCIAPSDPGGGWDFTCRTVGRLLTETGIIDSPVQTTNVSGGTGAVAYARVASSRASDEDLLVATSSVAITQIAQGKYPGGTDMMRWLAMLGADVGVIVVPADSDLKTLDDFLDAIRENPSSMTVGGSSAAGGWDHLRLLMLTEEAGIEPDAYKGIRWVNFNSGSPAVTQMLGGQVRAVVTDIGEIGGFVQSGDIRILVAMSDEPIPAFSDAPTTASLGYEMTGYNWRGFYVGGDVSDEAYEKWVADLKALYDTPEWKEAAEANGLIPIWRGGEEFNAYVDEQAEQTEAISREIGVIK
ncbi:tripartite tricarboxylate transporter substrate binding protein [Acuticoccus sp. 2012]|uniref:Tripartite tricarboxylate transporter substrate binding protein n=2 Tax=Acuticoccus mangrovi TaxID=2796142 RepID=A0A934IU55_9HYPH|nr:tripartite tricarboxylate transporter substrate-binding protein [Acuticoccus mangrovi]MBJ3778095.1 tripartite tricarboxylate transporter substrate binding protein [Acuticoccus mangrovi]